MLFKGVFLGLFLFPLFLFAQEKYCGFEQKLSQEIQQNPTYKNKIIKLEEAVKNFSFNKSDTIIRIPVVFHVVYRTEAQNISNTQIISQLKVLNEDYRKMNSDTHLVDTDFQKSDAKIEFCFAGKDTNGMDFSGVTRTQTSVYQIGQNSNQLFQLQPVWDSKKYLNIYVCEIGGGNAGYSSYPGGNPETDAVVIDYTNFGEASDDPNYNLGRTVTHEVGHWLGLYHIWGISQANCNDDDMVADTPNQGKVYTSCPIGSQSSCGSKDMTTNFMGYVYDRCMAAFTPGQTQRMRAMITTARPLISSAIPCSTNPIQPNEDSSAVYPLVVYPNPTKEYLFVYQKNSSFLPSDLQLFAIDGKEVLISAEQSGDRIRIDFTGLKAGIYLLRMKNKGSSMVRKVFFKGMDKL